MNELISAAHQALAALESYSKSPYIRHQHPKRFASGVEAITALKAALAKPTTEDSSEVEPVASIYITPNGAREFDDWRHDLPVGSNLLYTAPPQRKPPATIDEMFDRMDKAPKGVFFGHDPMTIWMEAWRAAEQQHGIT